MYGMPFQMNNRIFRHIFERFLFKEQEVFSINEFIKIYNNRNDSNTIKKMINRIENQNILELVSKNHTNNSEYKLTSLGIFIIGLCCGKAVKDHGYRGFNIQCYWRGNYFTISEQSLEDYLDSEGNSVEKFKAAYDTELEKDKQRMKENLEVRKQEKAEQQKKRAYRKNLPPNGKNIAKYLSCLASIGMASATKGDRASTTKEDEVYHFFREHLGMSKAEALQNAKKLLRNETVNVDIKLIQILG